MSLSFPKTPRIQKAVRLMNEVNTAKFPLILSRISHKLHLQEERAFSESEEKKLESALRLDHAELQLVITTCEFILQQTAYHSAKPAVLETQLTELGLAEDKVSAIVVVWEENGRQVTDELRHRTLPHNQLSSVDWSLGLEMASSSLSKTKSPTATLQLGILNTDTKQKETVSVEFSHQELYSFYNQLETIQQKVDQLS